MEDSDDISFVSGNVCLGSDNTELILAMATYSTVEACRHQKDNH
jgi:hypothetical protein